MLKTDKKDPKPKILMIENNHFLRKVFKNKMSLSGFSFIEATNGEEGLNKIISEKPDIVLLDIILPIKNGFDVLLEMKESEEAKDIPVVIFSDLGQEPDIERGMALGARDYLIKSQISLSEVVNKLKKLAKV